MASVYDVAKYILEKKGPMSTWKLQKLCYYAQAWSLAWDDKELFPEEFEAWKNGPVSPALFGCHRGQFFVGENDFQCGTSSNLDDNATRNIDIVLEFYGDKEPHWLRAQTHSEDPWIIARGGLPEDASCNNVITKESMGLYYGGL